MGLFSRFFNKENENRGVTLKLVTERGSGFYAFDGKLYKSDVIKACIRPKVRTIGKLDAKHIKTLNGDMKIFPEPYMRVLLEEPNPFMTGQMLQEKIAAQVALNHNAFVLIYRDENGYPIQLYPIPAVSAQAVYKGSEIWIKFMFKNGKTNTFDYRDIIHIRRDFNTGDMFGDSPIESLLPLMEVISYTDQGIVKAIKNSNVIQWLLKLSSMTRPEDRKKQADLFVKSYLDVEADGTAAAAIDPTIDAQQVKPESYVPNASIMDRTMTRIYNFFNTNEKIVQSKANEDEWIAYYESEIEPDVKQLSGEFTRKLFSRKQRAFGNVIVFTANSLQYASMQTKLGLVAMVDRGAMTPNEWREILNMGPIEGGNQPIRRLDTAVVNELKIQISNMIRESLGGE
ncbi:MAG: phage portal protein [Clostridia bacterium]|nr:phage portal protein [Clostridia bacterium]